MQTQLTHHGMVFVPIGYTSPEMTNMNEIKGGSPYGAGSLAGNDGSRQVSAVEYSIAKHQGSLFATFVRDLYKGRAANGK
jgi:NAD(P)H dehydrogenase (quinone)